MIGVPGRKELFHRAAITLEAPHAWEIIGQARARFGMPGVVSTYFEARLTEDETGLWGNHFDGPPRDQCK